MASMRNLLSLTSVIGVFTGITLAYLFSILAGASLVWVLGLFCSSMMALVWMVVRILKDPWSTNKTFDEYFYQDRRDFRRSDKH
jgi:hypothetical protein